MLRTAIQIILFMVFCIGGASAQTTIFTSGAFADNPGANGYTIVNGITTSQDSLGQIIVTFKSGTTGSLTINDAYYCIQSSTFNCTAAPVQLKFGGSSSATIVGANQTVSSDLATFATPGTNVLVCIDVGASGDLGISVVGSNSYFQNIAAECSLQTKAQSYSTAVAGEFSVLSITTQAGTGGPRLAKFLFAIPGGAPSCSFGVGPDGCTAGQVDSISGLTASAPPHTSTYTLQDANFFNSAAFQESSQSYVNTGACTNLHCHPPWNVAGVDYPVGVDASFFPLLDPTTSPPSGCTYCPANTSGGGCINAGELAVMKSVQCHSQSSYTVQGYDFGTTAQGCMVLRFIGAVTNITVINNRFAATGSNCWAVSPTYLVTHDTATTGTCTLSKNYFDGNANGGIPLANNLYMAALNCHNTTVTYNALVNLHTDGIQIAAGGSDTPIVEWNYARRTCAQAGQTYHCHQFWIVNVGRVTSPDANQSSCATSLHAAYGAYNTTWMSKSDSGATAEMYFATGSGFCPATGGVTWAQVSYYNNVGVGNVPTNPSYNNVNPESAYGGAHDIYTSTVWINNYLDPSGMTNGLLILVSPGDGSANAPSGTGNVNMVTGATCNTFTNSGGWSANGCP